MTIRNVIFDLGGVLIDWNPDYVYDQVITDETTKAWFYREVCTMEWNENQDAGYPMDKATEERVALFPHYEEWIRMYYGRWEEMLGDAIPDAVAVLKKCIDTPTLTTIALTNWSAETFPIALNKFEFLHWFEGIVVSGEEKTRKPFAEIYQRALLRYGFRAEETVFIDDNQRNVRVAEQLGIKGIHFRNPAQLNRELIKLDIL